MKRATCLAAALFALAAAAASAEPTPDVELSIDATHASHRLLSSEMTLSVEPGERRFWHPNWLPGVTGPTEQVRNLVGLRFEDPSGQRLSWRRDPTHANLLSVSVPQGVDRLRVTLRYVMNQPTRLSSSVDSYGGPDLLVLNFNTCLLYPDAEDASRLAYRVRVKTPADFKHACALETTNAGPAGLDLGVVRLGRLIDSPLVAGRHAREAALRVGGAPDARVCVFGETPKSLEDLARREGQLERIMPQAVRLFGGAPFPRYTFLLVCSDQLPRFGLEHRESSLMTLRPDALSDDRVFDYRPAYLLPHELAHAWCGKQRTPRGMLSKNYHTPFDTELLWVYEGLTQYVMQLLAVRSGQVDLEHHLGYLADRVNEQAHRRGRGWRSLADTAVAARSLRGLDHQWRDLRRAQDYYDEGALFWLRVDCVLRASSGGEASLDNFCREFFHSDARAEAAGFDLNDVVATLDAISPGPWRTLIDRLIYRPHDQLDLEALRLAGYELGVTSSRPAHTANYEAVWEYASAEGSLGLIADKHGNVKHLRGGLPAAQAGVTLEGQIVSVNGRSFSRTRLRRAAADTADGKPVELIVNHRGEFRTCTLDYAAGARYPALIRLPDQPDRLRSILAPLPGRAAAPQPVAEESPRPLKTAS